MKKTKHVVLSPAQGVSHELAPTTVCDNSTERALVVVVIRGALFKV